MGENLKLTVEQLKNYLGTGLKFNAQGHCEDDYAEPKIPTVFEMIGIENFQIAGEDGVYVTGVGNVLESQFDIEDVIPICYRLSDLDKFIPELGFVPYKEIGWGNGCQVIPIIEMGKTSFTEMQKFFEWNFWVFDQEFFEAGLVIDKLKHGKEGQDDH